MGEPDALVDDAFHAGDLDASASRSLPPRCAAGGAINAGATPAMSSIDAECGPCGGGLAGSEPDALVDDSVSCTSTKNCPVGCLPRAGAHGMTGTQNERDLDALDLPSA